MMCTEKTILLHSKVIQQGFIRKKEIVKKLTGAPQKLKMAHFSAKIAYFCIFLVIASYPCYYEIKIC